LVEPIGGDRDGEAPEPHAEEGTNISEDATGKTKKFERFPGSSRTRNMHRLLYARGTQNNSKTEIKIVAIDSPTLRE
jgi:hypothetical protein